MNQALALQARTGFRKIAIEGARLLSGKEVGPPRNRSSPRYLSGVISLTHETSYRSFRSWRQMMASWEQKIGPPMALGRASQHMAPYAENTLVLAYRWVCRKNAL